MKRQLVALSIPFAMALATACAPDTNGDTSRDVTADLATIGDVRNAYAEAMRAGDPSMFSNLYADEARVMRPGMETAVGGDAIRNDFNTMFTAGRPTDVNINSEETEVMGDLAYDRGTYRMTVGTGDSTRTDEGRYLIVLRRQEDGAWKIIEEMANSTTMDPKMQGGMRDTSRR